MSGARPGSSPPTRPPPRADRKKLVDAGQECSCTLPLAWSPSIEEQLYVV
jgi:hypothetical protein